MGSTTSELAMDGDDSVIADNEEHSMTSTQIDRGMYTQLLQTVGSFDKVKFKKRLRSIYKGKVDELAHVRQALYDLALDSKHDTPRGTLVRRTNGGHSSAIEKYLDDVYALFHYIDGGTDFF